MVSTMGFASGYLSRISALTSFDDGQSCACVKKNKLFLLQVAFTHCG